MTHWRTVTWMVVACLIGLSAAELAARFVRPPMLYYRAPQVRYQPHPVRSFTLHPCQSGVYSVSAAVDVGCDGFRTNGSPQAAEGSPLILALGDSFTFGYGVANHETWPARLEAKLRTRGCPTARVINAGTISYGVFQELDLLTDRLPQLKPDVVIHGLYWNDYQSAHPPREGAPSVLTPEGFFVWDMAEPDGRLRGAMRWLLGHSSLATVAHSTGRTFVNRPAEAAEAYAVAYQRFVRGELPSSALTPITDFYATFSALAGHHGFRPYAVLVPSVNVFEPGALDNPYRRFVVTQLGSAEIPYVDGYALWAASRVGPSTFLPQGDDAHLSASGYEILAEAIAARILQGMRTAPLPACS